MTPLHPREAVAAILATPIGSREFFAGMTSDEYFALVATANPPRAGVQTEARRGAAALPGMDVGKKGKGKKARA